MVSHGDEKPAFAISKIADKPSAETREMKVEKPDGSGETLQVEKSTVVTEKDVEKVRPYITQLGAMEIELTEEGGGKMAAATKDFILKRMAVIVDGQLISAPTLKTAPLGRKFIIEGLHTQEAVDKLVSDIQKAREEEKK